MNRHLIDDVWLLYGESSVPGWIAVPLVFAAAWLARRFLLGERGARRGVAARLLPWTATLLAGMAALLLWRPAAVRVATWERAAPMGVWIDPSASMDASLAGSGATARLDALSFFHNGACAERVLSPRDLARTLGRLAEEALVHRRALEGLRNEAEQGLPPGERGAGMLESYAVWVRAAREAVAEHSARAHDAVAPFPERDAERAAIRNAEACAQALPPHAGEGTALPRTVDALDAFSHAAVEAGPSLDALQEFLDAAYAVREAARLAPLLERTQALTRRDAAERLLAAIPADVPVERFEAGERDDSDLPAAMDTLLRATDGVSHLILCADGGHDGPPDTALLERARRAGLTLLTLGIGLDERFGGMAIRDWECPRIARAGRQVRLAVAVKTPPGAEMPYTLSLSLGDTELASAASVSRGGMRETVTLSFTAPPAGRHPLTLRLAAGEVRPGCGEVRFVLDTVARTPEILLAGDHPDWDTAYLTLAAEHLRLNLRQVFTGTETPARGAVAGAMPETEAQWKVLRAVILRGATFKGFAESDAKMLHRYVHEFGGTLVIMAPGEGSFAEALAPVFGWSGTAPGVQTTPLALTAAGRGEPFLRLGTGGAHSARILRELGIVGRAAPVPEQALTLLEGTKGEPLLTVGIYGRGRVYLFGAGGLHRLREYERAAVVDRLLGQWLGEIASPLSPEAGAKAFLYPVPAQAGGRAVLSLPADAPETVEGLAHPPVFVPAGDRKHALVEPAGIVRVTVEGTPYQWDAFLNPGREMVDGEYDGRWLRDFSEAAGARFLPLDGAAGELGSLRPVMIRERTSNAWRPADHMGFLVLLLLIGTLHWTLRKLAGMAV